MLTELFVLILTVALTASCPRRENLYPCTCESSGFSDNVKCSNVQTGLVLLNAANALRGMKSIRSFTIENSVLRYIPHDLFDDVRFEELAFKSSAIRALSDADVAFKGLENYLTSLTVNDCSYINSWDWSLLKNMKNLVKVHVDSGDMVSIDRNVREINPSILKDLSFSNNAISYIYDFAFSNFTALETLTLSHNMIKDVKRTMLPNPAANLMQINLGYNEIQQLPDDFFTDMPSLKHVSISSNNILTLREQTFNPVWGQLVGFEALDCKLRCDCRISWIFEREGPKEIKAICEQPSQLKGKNLIDLNAKEVWC